MVLACACVSDVEAQKRTRRKPPAAAPAKVTELTRLREQYVQATKDYKASLEKLLISQPVQVAGRTPSACPPATA